MVTSKDACYTHHTPTMYTKITHNSLICQSQNDRQQSQPPPGSDLEPKGGTLVQHARVSSELWPISRRSRASSRQCRPAGAPQWRRPSCVPCAPLASPGECGSSRALPRAPHQRSWSWSWTTCLPCPEIRASSPLPPPPAPHLSVHTHTTTHPAHIPQRPMCTQSSTKVCQKNKNNAQNESTNQNTPTMYTNKNRVSFSTKIQLKAIDHVTKHIVSLYQRAAQESQQRQENRLYVITCVWVLMKQVQVECNRKVVRMSEDGCTCEATLWPPWPKRPCFFSPVASV